MSVIINALKKLQKNKTPGVTGLPIRTAYGGPGGLWKRILDQRHLILGTALVLAVVAAAFVSPLKNLWHMEKLPVFPGKKVPIAAIPPEAKKPAPPPMASKDVSLPQEAPAQPVPTPPAAVSPTKDKTTPPVKISKSTSQRLKKGATRPYATAVKPAIPSLPPMRPQLEEKRLNGRVTVKTFKDLPYHFNQGTTFQNQKNFPKAIEAYAEVLKIDPNYAEAYNNLGIIYNQMGNFEKAVFHLQKAIAANPNYFKSYNNLGVILYENGHFEEAANQFWKAIEIHAKNMESYVNLALVSRKQKNLELAQKILQQAFSIDPKSPEVSYHLGLVAEEKGDYQEAIEYYQRFLQLSSRQDNSLAQKVKEHMEQLERLVVAGKK